ncbi:hypothetical protein GCM10010399_03280 [Dactylosporangium fulvum]
MATQVEVKPADEAVGCLEHDATITGKPIGLLGISDRDHLVTNTVADGSRRAAPFGPIGRSTSQAQANGAVEWVVARDEMPFGGRREFGSFC